MKNGDKITIELELTADQAWELATVLKRLSLSDYRLLTTDMQSGLHAFEGAELMREALAKVGIDPR